MSKISQARFKTFECLVRVLDISDFYFLQPAQLSVNPFIKTYHRASKIPAEPGSNTVRQIKIIPGIGNVKAIMESIVKASKAMLCVEKKILVQQDFLSDM